MKGLSREGVRSSKLRVMSLNWSSTPEASGQTNNSPLTL